LLVGGEVVQDAALFLAAKGRVSEDDVDTVSIAYFRDLHGERVAVFNIGVFEPVQEKVHLHEHVGERLGLLAEERFLLEHATVSNGFAACCEVVVSLDEKAARAATVSPSCGAVTSTMNFTTGRGV
jgi:hypothetical protein